MIKQYKRSTHRGRSIFSQTKYLTNSQPTSRQSSVKNTPNSKSMMSKNQATLKNFFGNLKGFSTAKPSPVPFRKSFASPEKDELSRDMNKSAFRVVHSEKKEEFQAPFQMPVPRTPTKKSWQLNRKSPDGNGKDINYTGPEMLYWRT